MIYCFLLYTKVSYSVHAPNIKNSYSLPLGFFFSFLVLDETFFYSTELLNSLRRNGERSRLRNPSTATGVTMCGHQPAVILVKLMFCRRAVQRFLLRRTLYPVFHSQWSCVSFPLCNAVWAQSCDPVLWIVWHWIEGDYKKTPQKTLNVSKNIYNSTINVSRSIGKLL